MKDWYCGTENKILRVQLYCMWLMKKKTWCEKWLALRYVWAPLVYWDNWVMGVVTISVKNMNIAVIMGLQNPCCQTLAVLLYSYSMCEKSFTATVKAPSPPGSSHPPSPHDSPTRWEGWIVSTPHAVCSSRQHLVRKNVQLYVTISTLSSKIWFHSVIWDLLWAGEGWRRGSLCCQTVTHPMLFFYKCVIS